MTTRRRDRLKASMKTRKKRRWMIWSLRNTLMAKTRTQRKTKSRRDGPGNIDLKSRRPNSKVMSKRKLFSLTTCQTKNPRLKPCSGRLRSTSRLSKSAFLRRRTLTMKRKRNSNRTLPSQLKASQMQLVDLKTKTSQQLQERPR